MEETAELPGKAGPVEAEGDLVGVDAVKLDLEAGGGAAEVCDHRGYAGFGRHAADSLARAVAFAQCSIGEPSRRQALDEDGADAVDDVFSRGARMTAQRGQPAFVFERGDLVGDRDAEAAPACFAGELDDEA